MAQQLNPSRTSQLRTAHIQCVNVWKPIVGPVRDWPLALCSSASIDDPTTQFEPCDLVYPDYVVENRQVYHSEACDWFYASDMMPHEAWVFLQSDTDESTKPGESIPLFYRSVSLKFQSQPPCPKMDLCYIGTYPSIHLARDSPGKRN